MTLAPISSGELAIRAAMGRGHAGFLALVAPEGADLAGRIEARIGHATTHLDAAGGARSLAEQLHAASSDPVIVSGLDHLSDETWRQLDRLRNRLVVDRLTVLVLSAASMGRLARCAPNLASLFGAGFFRWEEPPEPPRTPAIDDEAQAEFERLAQQWREETCALSSMTRIVAHPAYQAIIAMGERAIPSILRDLQRAPDLWGPALHAITGARPVPPADAGRVARVAEAWIRWARENGYAW